MNWHWSDKEDRDARENGVLDHPAVIRIAAVFAIAFFCASFFPIAIVPVVLQEILLLAGVAFAMSALFMREDAAKRTFSRWDEAVVLAGLAIFCGMFADPEAARQTLEAMTQTGPATVAEGMPETGSS